MKYAIEEMRHSEPCVRVKQGSSAIYNQIPDAVYPVGSLKVGFHWTHIVDNGAIREKTLAEKQDYIDSVVAARAIREAELEQETVEWNNSKANYPLIIKWENRMMLRLQQVNTLLYNAGLISEPLTPLTGSPAVVASLVIDSSLSDSAVDTALERCRQWQSEIQWGVELTEELIGLPPNGAAIREYVSSHE